MSFYPRLTRGGQNRLKIVLAMVGVGVLFRMSLLQSTSTEPPPAMISLYRRPLVVRTFYYTNPNRAHVGYGGRSAAELFDQHGWTTRTQSADVSNDWDLLWTFAPQYHALPPGIPQRWQKHNHCLAMSESWGVHGTKESQWQCYVEMRRRFGPGRFGFMPETFTFPTDLRQWKIATDASPGALWILKSSAGARGEGIQVVNRAIHDKKLVESKGVIQRYVSTPLLVNNRKFHLRLYVVISNLAPLRVLLSTTGMMMVAAEEFTVDPASFTNRRVHLTNSAVGATIHTLADFWKHIDSLPRGAVDNRSLWASLSDLAVKIAFSSQVGPPSQGSTAEGRFGFEPRQSGTCFDLFG
jgi:hypothetical protein